MKTNRGENSPKSKVTDLLSLKNHLLINHVGPGLGRDKLGDYGMSFLRIVRVQGQHRQAAPP